jgi:hypothetical protein
MERGGGMRLGTHRPGITTTGSDRAILGDDPEDGQELPPVSCIVERAIPGGHDHLRPHWCVSVKGTVSRDVAETRV